MERMLNNVLALAGAMIGGWIGWWLGARFGPLPGMSLSLVGTALGIYLARRITRQFLG